MVDGGWIVQELFVFLSDILTIFDVEVGTTDYRFVAGRGMKL